MNSNPDRLGGRTPLLRPDELTGARRRTYDIMNETMVPWAEKSGFEAKLPDGRMIGPFNGFLFSPEMTQSFLDWQMVEQKHTTLTGRERQIIILATGAVWRCDYERYAHAAVARGVGLSEAAIAALRVGDPAPDLSPKEETAQRFTTRIAADHRIDKALFAETLAAFDLQGVSDIIQLAGQYMTISSLLNAFEVPAPAY